MVKNNFVIFGAGQHASVLMNGIDSARAFVYGFSAPIYKGMLDDADCVENMCWREEIIGKIHQPDDQLRQLLEDRKIGYFLLGVGSVDSNGNIARCRLYERGRRFGLQPFSYLSPYAAVAREAGVNIDVGTQILHGASIGVLVTIKENALINTRAIIEHNCYVHAHAHIATGAILCGGVTVGVGSFIGAGAVIKNDITIGDHATVGAGAVVVSDVADGDIVVGNPAKSLVKALHLCPNEKPQA